MAVLAFCCFYEFTEIKSVSNLLSCFIIRKQSCCLENKSSAVVLHTPNYTYSHHWASLGFHFAGLNPISLVGLSGWPGEGRYPKHINWSLGLLRARFLDPSSSPHTLHHWLPSYRHMASPTISTLMTHSSISHFDQMIQR